MGNTLFDKLRLKVLYRTGFLNNQIRIFKPVLHGRKWTIPVVDGMGYGTAYGIETEEWVYNTIKKLHNEIPAIHFLDIGVNTGQTLLKVKSIDPAIRYIGFEPNPNCIFYVDYLRRLNNINDVQLICTALGEKEEFLELYYEGIEDTRATVIKDSPAFPRKVFTKKVPVVPLDKFQYDFDPSDRMIIKIDVEGFELEVLKGSQNFIRKHRPILIFEMLPHLNNPQIMDRYKQMYELLKHVTYNIYPLYEESKTGDQILEFNNAQDYTRTDFLATPRI